MNNSLYSDQVKKSIQDRYTMMAESRDFQDEDDYISPTEFAHIKKGDVVVDLGSGLGADCFAARSLTGEKGFVIGIDFTEKMVEKASLDSFMFGYANVEFRYGDIESIPVLNDSIDVVISNRSLNLVPDIKKAFSEVYRILKTGGHFCISDTLTIGKSSGQIRKDEEADGIAGAKDIDLYLDLVKETGFVNLKILYGKRIGDNFSREQMIPSSDYPTNIGPPGTFMVTLFAEKPWE